MCVCVCVCVCACARACVCVCTYWTFATLQEVINWVLLNKNMDPTHSYVFYCISDFLCSPSVFINSSVLVENRTINNILKFGTHFVESSVYMCVCFVGLLCNLVARVPGYRSRGPGSISGEVVALKRGPLSLVSRIEELLERKSNGSGLENRDYDLRGSVALTMRHQSIRKSWL
jgi:hypothetical protein